MNQEPTFWVPDWAAEYAMRNGQSVRTHLYFGYLENSVGLARLYAQDAIDHERNNSDNLREMVDRLSTLLAARLGTNADEWVDVRAARKLLGE